MLSPYSMCGGEGFQSVWQEKGFPGVGACRTTISSLHLHRTICQAVACISHLEFRRYLGTNESDGQQCLRKSCRALGGILGGSRSSSVWALGPLGRFSKIHARGSPEKGKPSPPMHAIALIGTPTSPPPTPFPLSPPHPPLH